MRTYILLFSFAFCLFCGNVSFAQHGKISGKVTDVVTSLSAATVSLLNGIDSSCIKTVITDDDGEFSFNEINEGNYVVSATSIGYETGRQLITVNVTGNPKFTIVLQKQNTSLQEVTVAAKKPFIEMSLGKTIVNIEGTTTTAGSTALDLMRRLPGVSVDMNGVISMQDKEGVLVLIDDRPTYLSGDDLAAYLKTITADDAAQIELITQPGAKYDASGNTGIINIKLKKNKKSGWNGNITGSYGNGIYFHRNEGFLVNYKKDKLSLSLSGIDMEGIGFADWQETRRYIDAQTGQTTSTSIIHSTPKERFSNTALRLTADFDVSDKTTIGMSVRGTYHPNVNHIYTSSINTDLSNNATTYNNIVAPEGFIRKNVMANAYLTHKFTKERTLDINFDYLAYNKNTTQDITNTTYDSLMHPLPNPAVMHSAWPEMINVYSIKIDQTYDMKDGIKLELGLKSSWETTDFNANVSLYENNSWTNAAGLSNHFYYRENINAAYVTASKNLARKWEAHVGLRAEQTNTLGIQYVNNDRFSRNYVSLFPTAFVTYKKDTNNQFEINYGRRIDRPHYDELNPFIYYSFENYYSEGNPYLQPQFTNSLELKHSYKNMIIAKLDFSGTTGIMSDVYSVNDTTKAVYNTTQNLATNNSVSLVIIFNKELSKWWSLNLSGSTFYAEFTGVINNQKLTAKLGGGSLDMNTQIDLGKGWKTKAYISYISGGRKSLTTSFDQHIYIEGGISKKINDHFLVKADFNDPFYMYRLGIHTYMNNYQSDSKFRYASKSFGLSLTYNFGGKQGRERNESTMDEANRIK